MIFQYFPDRFGPSNNFETRVCVCGWPEMKETGDATECRCSSKLWIFFCRCAVHKSTYLPDLALYFPPTNRCLFGWSVDDNFGVLFGQPVYRLPAKTG